MSNVKSNNFFIPLENTRPFLKAAFQGFPKSGKSYTATELAIGLHKFISSTKPIVLFDTEESFKALLPKFQAAKIKVETKESRSLADLNKTMQICNEGYADILIIDSITHVYENYLDAFKTQFKRDRLQFQDWGIIKPKWKAEFSTPFVRAHVHIIFTGRAGYEYEQEKNEETGKKEITKSGIKMKAETETAFEPDILVMMERVQDTLKGDKAWREATIFGDRTDVIDGKIFKNPTFKDFEPAVKVYLSGKATSEHTQETPDKFELKEDYERYQENKSKDIQEAEIKATFEKYGFSGQMGKDLKSLFVKIFEKIFEVKSLELAKEKYNAYQLKKRAEILERVLNDLSKYPEVKEKESALSAIDITELFLVEAQTDMNLN